MHLPSKLWRSITLSPRRSRGVLTEAEGFHGSFCPKKGMEVGTIPSCRRSLSVRAGWTSDATDMLSDAWRPYRREE